MSEDIEVGKTGLNLSWKMTVAVIVFAIGYYTATEIAPVREQQKECLVRYTKLNDRLTELEYLFRFHKELDVTP